MVLCMCILLNHSSLDEIVCSQTFQISTLARFRASAPVRLYSRGATDHKTHGSDHSMVFESRIGSFFRSAKKKKWGAAVGQITLLSIYYLKELLIMILTKTRYFCSSPSHDDCYQLLNRPCSSEHTTAFSVSFHCNSASSFKKLLL